MCRFLLIHGGGHGAWCWERLQKGLASGGCESWALDLPGHGEDAKPRQGVTLECYVRAVNDFIAEQELTDFTLVGHSLAGVALPGIWKLNRARIRSVVFLAALVLRKGEAAIDLIPEERRQAYFELAARSPDNSICFEETKAAALFFSDLPPSDAALFYKKLTPQPFAVYLERASCDPCFEDVRVRYIICSADHALPGELCRLCAEKLSVEPEWIDAGHDVMLSRPAKLVELLIRQDFKICRALTEF